MQTVGRFRRFDVTGRCESVRGERAQNQELQTGVALNNRLCHRIQTVSNDTHDRAARLRRFRERRDSLSVKRLGCRPASLMQPCAAWRIEPIFSAGRSEGSRAVSPFVSFVGTGPGEAELITLKAVRRLREAAVIIHDRLTPPEGLEYARARAEGTHVGKAPGRQYVRSEERRV